MLRWSPYFTDELRFILPTMNSKLQLLQPKHCTIVHAIYENKQQTMANNQWDLTTKHVLDSYNKNKKETQVIVTILGISISQIRMTNHSPSWNTRSDPPGLYPTVPGLTNWMQNDQKSQSKLKSHRESQKGTRADSIIQTHPPIN